MIMEVIQNYRSKEPIIAHKEYYEDRWYPSSLPNAFRIIQKESCGGVELMLRLHSKSVGSDYRSLEVVELVEEHHHRSFKVVKLVVELHNGNPRMLRLVLKCHHMKFNIGKRRQ